MDNHTNSDRSHVNKETRDSRKHDSHHRRRTKRDQSKHTTRNPGFSDQGRHGSSYTKTEKSADTRGSKGDHFVSDRKGDPGILRYGSNHSYEVPPYRRIGYGLVLGLSRSLKIDRELSTNKEIRLVSSIPTSNKRNKAIFAKVNQGKEYSIRPPQATSEIELDKNYLTLENGRRHGSHESTENSEDSDSPDYRLAIRKAKSVDVLDNSLEAGRGTANVGASSNPTKDTTWSQRIELDPSDAQAWMELIKQQTTKSSIRQTRAERLSSAEIKLSMYEKALKRVTGPMREDLRRGLFKEAAFVWDEAKIQRKWEETLRDYPQSFGLWKDYLDYKQTKSRQFRFDDLRTTFKEAFTSLRMIGGGKDVKIINNGSRHQSGHAEIGLYALYLLLRYTICLKQAGYIEQAIAIWQITLEVQLSGISDAKSEEAIEKFWESEVPRIGEPNAQGFVFYNNHGGSVPAEKEDSPKPVSKPLSIETWLDYEENVLKLLPARTLDITDEEDVFRVVLFPDIQPFLLHKFDISSESIIDAFLLFNGLPPLWQGETESWATDPFISGGDPMVKRTDETAQFDTNTDQLSGLSCRVGTDNLFAASKSPLRCFKRIMARSDKVGDGTSNLNLVGAVLRHVIDWNTNINHPKLIEYYLAFELRYHPKDVRKISKSYLKKYPQSLSLYNAHALVEYRLGNGESAKKVLETVMAMRPEDPDIILLRRTLAWESLEVGQLSSALGYLLGDSKSHDEAAIFATQQTLLLEMDRATSNKQHLVLSYMDCLLLLSYLTNPNPLSAALAIFQSNLSFLTLKLAKHTDILELSHQSLARLLYYHMQHHQYKPSTIRRAIQQSITAFPANAVFLSIFQLNEQRFRINDRVRSIVRDTLLNQDVMAASKSSLVVAHVFAIHAELSRSLSLGSSAEAIRSVFERAVEDDTTRNCPAIWYWYAEFELSQYNKEKFSQRAQNVIFRAMRACPWVRDFCLVTIRCLSKAPNGTEVKGFYEMMTERELRVRMILDV